ncbi:Uncharacterized protein dnm_007440 [Desulfonema magnum]|uniref:Uncharacterized protein n=1 Tax=Desulfonema magnum TaxID=45655 RepID=A0A975BGF6_9BACT|nr:Uncharacterized protein dnm_007440 [Desulfonema magnum]
MPITAFPTYYHFHAETFREKNYEIKIAGLELPAKAPWVRHVSSRFEIPRQSPVGAACF